MTTLHQEVSDIHAVPAQWLERGFRLLTLRELHNDTTPPAFAFIEQQLLRTPERRGRHGLYFGNTFRPEVMAWLVEHLGRPSRRERDDSPARRNASWPQLSWCSESRQWPEGQRTTEWFVDVVFPVEAHWTVFRRHWLDRLLGKVDPSAAMDQASHFGSAAELQQRGQ
ncbi:MAG: hypothetical protein J2P53_05480 [Bradyrhizobiaceae bacterium]|nr:hypothetical protein [Bradyrhizobiaceae bacterium]